MSWILVDVIFLFIYYFYCTPCVYNYVVCGFSGQICSTFNIWQKLISLINHVLLSFCTQSGGPSVILAPQIAPPDYCGLSWFACLLCFWPTGICAIMKSNEVTKINELIQKFSCKLITMQSADCRLPLLFYSMDQVQSHEFQLYD